MIHLSTLQVGSTLFGANVVSAYLRTGTRYQLHHADFDNLHDAHRFMWECDKKMLLHKLEQFIEQVTNGLSFRWHGQRQWVAKARPQLHELRGYLAHMQRMGVQPDAMAGLAELVEFALERSTPPEYLHSAVKLWAVLETIAIAFHERYSVTEKVESNG